MKLQSDFLKNSAYDKDMDNEPMFKGTVDIKGEIYDGEIFRKVQYGKEVLVLCLEVDEPEAPF
tara:strand:+ start:450 stop:638 length:189 start_codon:yes stop_codon:yes gene_type:complete